MPKDRKSRCGKRRVKKRLFIVCEGEKTEPGYLTRYVKDCGLRGKPVEVKILPAKRHTPKELVKTAVKVKELPGDEAWAVFDKDGYTRHGEAFNIAESKNVRIAFSSISFEIWILLHYEYATRSFDNAYKVIDRLKNKKYLDYDKADESLYYTVKGKTGVAVGNAGRVREYQEKNNPGRPIYELNPYTDFYELLGAINKLKDLY